MSAIEPLPVEKSETPVPAQLELVPEPGRIAIWWSELRVYLPTPANAAGLLNGVGAGSVVLVGRGWDWLWAEGWRDALIRAGGAALVGNTAFNVVATLGEPYTGYVAPVAVIGWCVAARLSAPKTGETAQEEEGEEGSGEGEHSTADRLALHVLAELARLEEEGKPGLHVTALIASAEEEKLLAPGALDKAAMRQWLEASGVPVTKCVKVRGEVDYGVRVDRFTEAVGIGPSEAHLRASEAAPTEDPSDGAPAPRLMVVKPLPEGADPDPPQEGA